MTNIESIDTVLDQTTNIMEPTKLPEEKKDDIDDVDFDLDLDDE